MRMEDENNRAEAFRMDLAGITPLTKEQAAARRLENAKRREELVQRHARKVAAAQDLESSARR